MSLLNTILNWFGFGKKPTPPAPQPTIVTQLPKTESAPTGVVGATGPIGSPGTDLPAKSDAKVNQVAQSKPAQTSQQSAKKAAPVPQTRPNDGQSRPKRRRNNKPAQTTRTPESVYDEPAVTTVLEDVVEVVVSNPYPSRAVPEYVHVEKPSRSSHDDYTPPAKSDDTWTRRVDDSSPSSSPSSSYSSSDYGSSSSSSSSSSDSSSSSSSSSD